MGSFYRANTVDCASSSNGLAGSMNQTDIRQMIGENHKNVFHKNSENSRAVVAHAFIPSTWEAEAGGFLSSRPAWSTKVSSRTAKAIQRNPVSKNKKYKTRRIIVF